MPARWHIGGGGRVMLEKMLDWSLAILVAMGLLGVFLLIALVIAML